MSWRRRFNSRQGTPASSSGLRPLGRSSTTKKPAPCAVVVIDEEDDGDGSDSEVFIVDADAAGKAVPAMSRCQTKKADCFSGNVINLDDDEEEEVPQRDKAGPSTAGDTGSPGATTPGRASPRNRYGLDCTSGSSESDASEGCDTEAESDDYDDDTTSDCEIMDDTGGTARKMWETAASSRKKMPNGVHNAKEGMATASTSSSGSETQSGENAEGLFGSESHVDEDIFRFFQDADSLNCSSSAWDGPAEYNLNGNMHFSDAWKGRQTSTSGASNGHGPSTVPDAKERFNENVYDGKETECVQNSNGDTKDSPAHRTKVNVSDGKETERVQNSKGDTKDSLAHRIEELYKKIFCDAGKEGAQNDTGAAKDGPDPSSWQNAKERSDIYASNGERPDTRASPTLDSDTACNDKTSHFQNGAAPENVSDGIHFPHLDQTAVDSFISARRVFPASSLQYGKDGSPPMCVSTPEKMEEGIPEGICSRKDQSPSDAHNVTPGSCSLSQKDVTDDPKGLGQIPLVQEASDFQDVLIGEREKHKETAEFKRAAEEEWASRQRQLQIQAEEAKKLRKRKKADALRLLMEKKQKQRLEEVRESQRKNEEEIQFKEQYRCEVRKELEDTERRYRDTMSILRALGIPVEGGKVRAALKQAQVKFHPDRASRSDIYQQVKAEETFKFISRLKENLPRFLL